MFPGGSTQVDHDIVHGETSQRPRDAMSWWGRGAGRVRVRDRTTGQPDIKRGRVTVPGNLGDEFEPGTLASVLRHAGLKGSA